MGRDISWKFSQGDFAWLKSLLSAAPHFKKFNDPYFEYYSLENAGTHPDAIASISEQGVDFTSFGDPKVLTDIQKYLEPLLSKRCGKIEESY